MEGASVVISVVMLIAGLGIEGASATEVYNALDQAGYNYTPEQINQIYMYANDPVVIGYIDTYHDQLVSDYNYSVQTGVSLHEVASEELSVGVYAIEGLIGSDIYVPESVAEGFDIAALVGDMIGAGLNSAVAQIVAGLGLSGASEAEVSSALDAAGFEFTAEQETEIYQYANDSQFNAFVSANASTLSGEYAQSSTADLQASASQEMAVGVYGAHPSITAHSISGSGASSGSMADTSGGHFYLVRDNNSCVLMYTGADGQVTQIYGYFSGSSVSGYDFTYEIVPSDTPGEVTYSFYLDGHLLNEGEFSMPAGAAVTVKDDTYRISIAGNGDLVLPGGKVVGDADDGELDGMYHLPDGTIVVTNPDGSYSLGKLNPDGTISLEDDLYLPSYDLSGLTDNDLIGNFTNLQDTAGEVDLPGVMESDQDRDTFDDTADVADDITDDLIDDLVDDPALNVDLQSFMAPSRIINIFPFCIPFDFVRGVKLLSVKPVAPKFVIPFEIPSFGSYPGSYELIVLDFSKYEKYFVIVRWLSTVLFLIGLGFVTTKIVKGAGA